MDMDGPPEKIASDYAEMVLLVIIFFIGAPLNLAAFTQLAEKPAYTRLDILKRHLNYTDLLVLFIYVPSRACWLATYDWRGGDFLCRFIKFLHTFAFQASSNVIVVIAVDRLLTVTSAAHRRPETAHRRMHLMLSVAWSLAMLISGPQFAVWRTHLAFKVPEKWSQCMTIWEIAKIESRTKPNVNGSKSSDIVANKLMSGERIYSLLHMLFIFWIPLLIILLCYMIVSCWVYLNSKPSHLIAMSQPMARPDQDRKSVPRLRLGAVSYCNTEGGNITFESIMMSTTALNRPKILINGADGLSRASSENEIINATQVAFNGELHTKVAGNGVTSSLIRASQSSTCSTRANRQKAIRVSLFLINGYLICWLPYNGLSLIQYFNPEAFSYATQVYFLHGFIVFNSVINPFIYGIFGTKLCCRKTTDR